MKANELRLGNYIAHKYSGIINVDLNSISLVQIQDSEKIEFRYAPIRIVEELLPRMGFNRLGYQYYELGVVRICTHEFGWLLSFNGNDVKEIQYVHQLQNLYFALTNNELTLKP